MIGVAAAKKTVLKFLQDKERHVGLVIADTVDAVIADVMSRNGDSPSAPARPEPVPAAPESEITPAPEQTAHEASEPEPIQEPVVEEPQAPEPVVPDLPPEDDAPEREPDPIDLENDAELISDEVLDAVLNRGTEKAARPEPTPAPEPPHTPEPPQPEPRPAAPEPVRPAPRSGDDPSARELKKRIVQYNTLLSINNDFARIHDRKNLLDAFLLTVIAQVGVESAVFLQRSQGFFYPVSMKGIDADELRGLALDDRLLMLERWRQTREIYSPVDAPFDAAVKAPLLSIGCSYIVPFIVHGSFRGIVLLGRPIRNDLDENTIEFLKILVNQAAIAYESTSKLEEENERSLGLVQTLIALIEENTVARGNTKLVSAYVYALAESSHYPEEHIRDLMYGTVLRDIGMIKVSDLIVRSPRELMPEEWDVIKRHPIDGADMIRRMGFSEHAANIVQCHHERFNGEGYPDGLQGPQIPLGARVVSVVESYAAMLQERPTRPALTRDEALNTLRENWGTRYDANIVKQFIEVVEREIRSGESVVDRKFELFRV